jgi:GNAT superfamily N-acetyltransferase
LAIEASPDLSSEALRLRLADIGAALHDPDYVFYLPVEGSADPLGQHNTACRQLGEADRAAFEAFQASASEQDLDDAYVELDHWAVFGSFEAGRLACAGSMYPWDNAPIADMGVLTLPALRGKGHACALVRTMSRYARQQGFEPQYRCQMDNLASVALAKASGLMLFGTWEAS